MHHTFFQLVQLIRPGLQIVQFLGAELKTLLQIPQSLRHVIGLGLKGIHPLVQLVKGISQASGGKQCLLRRPQLRHGPTALLPATEAVEGALDSGEKLLAVAQDLPPLEQFLLLAAFQFRPLQFANLKAQAVHPALLLRLIHLQAPHLPAGGLHGGVAGAVGLQKPLHTAVAVQIGAMLLLVQQLLTIMLAVNIQQLAANPPQLGHRHGPAIDPAGIFPVGIDLPLQQQFPALRRESAFRQYRQVRHILKHGADKGLGCAGTDQIPAGALAQHRPHGIDYDGFPRAGFSGQGIETAVKGDVRLLNDSDILNMQQIEHGSHSFPPAGRGGGGQSHFSISWTSSQKPRAEFSSRMIRITVSSPARLPTI